MRSPARSISPRESTWSSTARVVSSIAGIIRYAGRLPTGPAGRCWGASDEGERLDVGFAAREAADVERAGVHRDGAAVGEHLGHELAGDRSVHEAVAAEASDDGEA